MKTKSFVLSRRDILRGAAAGGSLLAGGSLFGSALAAESYQAETVYRFPKGFLWGAGTAGLQHEGSPLADGARPSMMYTWAHTPGKVPPGGTFDVTADFYRRFRSDIQLMRELGLKAYNFEVYWPRVLPDGTGKANKAGLAFYDQLVDEFLKADIAPLCNLFVFDHPQAVQDRGGWLNRDCASWYADYAALMFKHLGDRVRYWTTICEIQFLNHLSYVLGALPPEKRNITAGLTANHHLLLGQGLAVQALRASGAKGQIGNQHALLPIRPASDEEADIAAAKRADSYFNLLATDPQFLGKYPADLVEWYGAKWPHDAIRDGDLKTIATPVDFFGADYYAGLTARHDPAATPGLLWSAGLQTSVDFVPGTGQGLRDALLWVHNRYGKTPIHLLEIGIHLDDTVENGKVHDMTRINYFRDLLAGAHRAISEGVDLRSCFIWAFLDGWEFGSGLNDRYGLVHVDFKTQERIVKDSGHWYKNLIAANGFKAEAGTAR